MKTKMVSVFAMVVMLGFIVASNSVYGQQQKKPSYRPVIKYPPNSRPAVYGVRGLSEIPKADVEMVAPETTRGAACCLEFENQTGFFVDIWLDKEYRGRISPWQQGYSLCNVNGFKTFTGLTIGNNQGWSGDLECAGSFVLGAK